MGHSRKKSWNLFPWAGELYDCSVYLKAVWPLPAMVGDVGCLVGREGVVVGGPGVFVWLGFFLKPV
jgi:hypothetical protein